MGHKLIFAWECFWPGCKEIIDTENYSIRRRYCPEHFKRYYKEYEKRRWAKKVKPCRPKKLELLLYLLKTCKIVSQGQIMAYCGMISAGSVHSHVNKLRKKGHKIRYKGEVYYFED